MEDIDFSSLTARYSSKGRTGYNPIMMYTIVTYANMMGIKSVDRIVELCERDLAFIWLAKGQRPKRDAFYDFIDRRLACFLGSERSSICRELSRLSDEHIIRITRNRIVLL